MSSCSRGEERARAYTLHTILTHTHTTYVCTLSETIRHYVGNLPSSTCADPASVRRQRALSPSAQVWQTVSSARARKPKSAEARQVGLFSISESKIECERFQGAPCFEGRHLDSRESRIRTSADSRLPWVQKHNEIDMNHKSTGNKSTPACANRTMADCSCACRPAKGDVPHYNHGETEARTSMMEAAATAATTQVLRIALHGYSACHTSRAFSARGCPAVSAWASARAAAPARGRGRAAVEARNLHQSGSAPAACWPGLAPSREGAGRGRFHMPAGV